MKYYLAIDIGASSGRHILDHVQDVQFLSESAFADACCPGNPRDTSVEEIAAPYRGLI